MEGDTGPPPFSLEEAEKWLHWLEDVATLARDGNTASMFVLGNLLMEMDRKGLIDLGRFLLRLRASLPRIEAMNERLATGVWLEQLLQQADAPADSGWPPPSRH